MFGKIIRGIGTVTKVAGPALAGLGIGGPIGAIITVTGQVAGAVTKRRGQAIEDSNGGPAGATHKFTAPVAASGASALAIFILKLFDIEMPTEQVDALLALVAPFLHQIGRGAEQFGIARS